MTRATQGEPNTSQVLESLMESVGIDLRVGCPGIIKSVNTDGITADIVPAIKQNGATAKDPIIPDVPLMFPRSGDATLYFPVSAGDAVWLAFSDRSIEEWLAGDGEEEVTADDPRTHDITDAVAFPLSLGSLPTGANGNLYLGFGGNFLKQESGLIPTTTLDATLGKLGAGATTQFLLKGTGFLSDLAALGILVTIWLNKLTPIIDEWVTAANTPTPGTTPWKPQQTTTSEFKAAQTALVAGLGTFLTNVATRISTKWKVE